MAKKNMQTLVMRNAVKAVRVTGMGCTGSLRADGNLQASFPSLLWHPLPGPFAIRTGQDKSLAEDTARTVEAVLRTGRSESRVLVASSPSTASAYAALAKRG